MAQPPNQPTGLLSTEPVATLGGAVLLVVVSGIALLQEFGVDITASQQTVLAAFAAALIGLVTLVQRSRVVPTGRANAAIESAAKNPTPVTQQGVDALKF